jgi:WD40 repeat protein/serine/threonine protein kinase
MKYHDETQRDRLARDIFLRALEIETLEARADYLDQASGNDDLLRSRVQILLQSHRQDSFLEISAVATAQPLPGLENPEPFPQLVGRYKLLQKIGEGGCGVVYMAEQEEPVRRRVALKIIKLGMDTKSVIARFEAERQALALMDHPNIAKVLDAGATDSGRPYFVMELVRGIKITEYCDQHSLSTRDRLDLFIKVCQAIQHAHQKGIIHRDIKPSNILVTLHDGVAVPKVIDFGIAKATTDQRLTDKTLFTALEQFIGTPAYMSPEQAEMSGLDIDTRCDIYSLGVLLYELLTGKTPFDAKELLASGIDAMRKTIREREPVPPSTKLSQTLVAASVSPNPLGSSGEKPGSEEEVRASSRRLLRIKETITLLRGDVDWIVMKCLEKDRGRRYETANGLGSDIQRHLNNETVLARPPSAAYRFQKLVRRNKLAFAAAATVTLALVAGLSFSTWAFLREAGQRRQAEAEKVIAQRLLYGANMNLAQQAWEGNNIGRVRQLLDETQHYTDRGFEWYYWQRQTHSALKTLRGHVAPVTSTAFSSDGQKILTGSYDGTAKLWDWTSGTALLTLITHEGGISSIAFSPGDKRIATGGDDGIARIWDAANGRELLTLKGHGAAILAIAFSGDGQRIVTGGDDHTAKVWEAANGHELFTLKGHGGGVLSVAVSSDNQRILTGSRDRTAKIWDATSGQPLLVLEHSGPINCVAFSPDRHSIITGSDDHTAKVWDAAAGQELLTLKQHHDRITSVAFSLEGGRIATASGDQTAKVFDAVNGEEVLTLKGHTAPILCLAFSPDGRQIVTGGLDHTAKVWEAATNTEVRTLKGHNAGVLSVAFSPDGPRIATGSFDRTARVWDADSGRELLRLGGHNAGIFFVSPFLPMPNGLSREAWMAPRRYGKWIQVCWNSRSPGI